MDTPFNSMDDFNFDNFNLNLPYDIEEYHKPKREYMTEYLKKHIGKMVKLEFSFGTCLEIRIGQLVEVGDKYVVLKLYRPATTILCDLSDIKFVTIAHSNEIKSLM